MNILAAFSVAEDWSTYVGGVYGNDCVKASAIDSYGNLYVGGYLGDYHISNDDGVDVTNLPVSANPLDGFVAEVNASGVLQWFVVLGDNESDEVRGVAESDQSVFAVASLERTATYDDGSDAYLYSLSKSDGSVNWSTFIGEAHATNGFNDVTVDTNGYIYAVGYTGINGLTPTAGGSSLQGEIDGCVVKISPAGSLVWVHYLGGENFDSALTCTIGTNGFLYVGGETYSTNWVSDSGGVFPSASNMAGFLVKLSTAGDQIWSTYLGGSQSDYVADIAIGSVSGNIFAAGSTRSSNFMYLKPRLNSHNGNNDGFVTSITDSGATLSVNWSKFYGSAQSDTISGIQQLDDSQLVVGGSTPNGTWLSDADNAHSGGSDGFVAVLQESSGTNLWSTYVGGSDAEYLHTLAAQGGVMYAGGLTKSESWISGGFHDLWDKDNLFGGAEEFGFLIKFISSGYIPDLPEIITQPQSISVEEQQDALFSIEAVSAEPLSYQWYVNSSLVTDDTNTSFTITAVTLAQDGDEITCIVSNVAGGITSDIATLTVTAIPMGWIKIDISPAEAVSDGAVWSIDSGSTWHSSGAVINTLTGEYSIVYKDDIFGWAAPSTPADTTVVNGQTNALAAVYTEVIYATARSISGTNVVVDIIPPDGTVYWILSETVPAGLTPYDYPAGSWNSETREFIYFVNNAAQAQFSYSVRGEVGTYQLSGSVNFYPSGVVTTVGDTQITISEDTPVVPNPDIIGFVPNGGVPGIWLLTFISTLNQSYLVETNSTPAAAGWAQQSQVNGEAGQTTTTVGGSPAPVLFYRVRTPAP